MADIFTDIIIFYKRIKAHLSLLSKGKHQNVILQEAYNLGYRYNYTPELLYFDIKHYAYEAEQKLISETWNDPTFVNIELGRDTFSKHPNREQIKEKITSVLNEFRSSLTDEEYRKWCSRPGRANGMWGKTHTADIRKVISEKIKDHYLKNGPPNIGIVRSEETKAKLSSIASQRIGDKNPFHGKSHTDDTKRKIALANTGRSPPNTRKVSVNNVEYGSLTEAGKKLGVHTTVVLFRVKSNNPKFSEWKWL